MEYGLLWLFQSPEAEAVVSLAVVVRHAQRLGVVMRAQSMAVVAVEPQRQQRPTKRAERVRRA
jgi:hypothetical protein